MGTIITMLSTTVIVPTHNRPDQLERALESIARQFVIPTSTLVVDDLDQESVKTVVGRWIDVIPSLGYVDASGDGLKTAGRSRNLGAAKSESDLIAFLDDDDRWDRRYLKHAVDHLTHSTSEIWTCRASISVGQSVHLGWQSPSSVWTKGRLPNGGVSGSNIVIRRRTFEAIGGYDASLNVWNDLDLELRAHLAGVQFFVEPADLVIQEGSGADHLTSSSPRRASGIIRFVDKNREHMSRADMRRARADIYGGLAVAASGADRAALLTLKAMNVSPARLLRRVFGNSVRPFRE